MLCVTGKSLGFFRVLVLLVCYGIEQNVIGAVVGGTVPLVRPDELHSVFCYRPRRALKCRSVLKLCVAASALLGGNKNPGGPRSTNCLEYQASGAQSSWALRTIDDTNFSAGTDAGECTATLPNKSMFASWNKGTTSPLMTTERPFAVNNSEEWISAARADTNANVKGTGSDGSSTAPKRRSTQDPPVLRPSPRDVRLAERLLNERSSGCFRTGGSGLVAAVLRHTQAEADDLYADERGQKNYNFPAEKEHSVSDEPASAKIPFSSSTSSVVEPDLERLWSEFLVPQLLDDQAGLLYAKPRVTQLKTAVQKCLALGAAPTQLEACFHMDVVPRVTELSNVLAATVSHAFDLYSVDWSLFGKDALRAALRDVVCEEVKVKGEKDSTSAADAKDLEKKQAAEHEQPKNRAGARQGAHLSLLQTKNKFRGSTSTSTAEDWRRGAVTSTLSPRVPALSKVETAPREYQQFKFLDVVGGGNEDVDEHQDEIFSAALEQCAAELSKMNLAVGHISPALQKSSGKRSDATALKRRKLTHLGVLARPFSRLPRRKTRGDPSLTEKSRKGKMPYQEKVRNGSGHERGKKAVRERRSFWARDQFCSLRRSEDPVEVDISAAQADRGTSTSGVLNPVGRASSNGKVSTSSSAAAASPCPLTDFLLEGVAAFEARHAGFVPRGNARFDVRRQLVHVGEDSVRQGLAGLLNALEIAEEVIDELSDLLDLKDDVLAKGVTSTSSGAVDERSKKKTKNTAALRKDEQKRQQARLEAKLRRLKFLTEVQREGRERKDGMVGTAERETWLDYLKTGTLEITAAYAAMFIVMKVYQHPVVLRVPRRALSNPVFLTFGNL